MATQVYKTEDITLQNGEDVTLKPLAIARLRRFMEAWDKFSEAEDDNDGFDVFINCCGIALEANYIEKYGSAEAMQASAEQKKKGQFLSKAYKADLEEILEMDSIYRIMDVCGGIKLNDPKLIEAAAALAEATGE